MKKSVKEISSILDKKKKDLAFLKSEENPIN